ncbi:hypothetical protein OIV83_002050 [Microbotryomycetes sp. JL201]|nr:hypothetical protein OIV83_002050 [Microbotryomycetes sp. JL201]
MRVTATSGTVLALLGFGTTIANAWGAAGHEAVATIAQIHLKPATRQALQSLLPYSNGYMPPIASWADRIRGVPMFHFASELHYTSPLDDYPPDECHFGDKGFKTDHDLLHAVTNYTSRLLDNPDDYVAVKFLVHFIGDLHQPLHLTNRDRGGNSFMIKFEGRSMNLHGLWDNQLIAKSLRDQRNYTRPLPARQIEDNLRGAIYDPFIRLILWEGVRQWWRSSLPEWFECPRRLSMRDTMKQFVLGVNASPKLAGPYYNDKDDVWSVICPVHWATQTHEITCARTFPRSVNSTTGSPELFTREYYSPIRDNNIIEKMLAQGGLRLAASLNAIFAPPTDDELGRLRDDGDLSAFVDVSWMDL